MAGDGDDPDEAAPPSDGAGADAGGDDAGGEGVDADGTPDGSSEDDGDGTSDDPASDDEVADEGEEEAPDVVEDEETAGPTTCAGVTQDGSPCGRRVAEAGDYCYLHEDQADDEDVEVYEPPADVEASDWDGLDDYEPSPGPAGDREQPLAEHIEEMLKRLAVVVAVAGLVSLATFPFAEYLINVIWNGVLPAGEVTRPRLYGILELKLTELKVASLAGVIVALPVLVYETYQFMKPGLYPHERRYYLAAIPTSLVLALVGVSFAYFVVLPAIFTYFLYYSQTVATIGFALGRTFDLILLLMGYLAIVFQIPLFIMLAMMMGLVTRRWLAERRLLFWGAFLGISFIFSPDPTGMAPIVVALTMIALFEGTLLLTRWTSRGGAGGRGRTARQ